MTQIEAIFQAIQDARLSGQVPVELRMQSATHWKLEPELPDVVYIKIVEDETVKKGSVEIHYRSGEG